MGKFITFVLFCFVLFLFLFLFAFWFFCCCFFFFGGGVNFPADYSGAGALREVAVLQVASRF